MSGADRGRPARGAWIAVGLVLALALGGLSWLLLGGAIGETGGRSTGPGAGRWPNGAETGGAGDDAQSGAAEGEAAAEAAAAREEIPYGDTALPRAATIRGRVLDSGQVPVAEAVVTAWLRDTAARPHRIVRASRVRTAADGTFVLGPLERQRFQIVAEHPDHGIAAAQSEAAGSWVELVLVEAAALEGRVTARSDGAPVEGARVVLANGQLVEETLTDGDGRYRIAPAVPAFDAWNGARVIVVTPDFLTAERSRVMIAPGDTATADFALETGATLSGRVLDAVTREPVGDALVLEGLNPWDRSTATDAEGRYALAHVDVRANRTFAASAPGYRTANRQCTGDASLDFELFRAGAVEVRVRTPQGAPAEGARVYLQQVETDADPLAVSTAQQRQMVEVADAAGRARFEDLLPGKVAVMAFHPAFAPGEAGPVEVRAGGGPATADVTLREGLTIEGVVRDGEGTGLPGVRVRVQPGRLRQGDYSWAGGLVWGEAPDTVTDEEGAFTLEGAIPGQHRLYAWDSRWGYGSTEIEGVAGQRLTDVEIRFGGAGIDGVVLSTDGRPLAGIQVFARRTDGDSRRSRRMGGRGSPTDALGRFFIAGLEEGVYEVTARSPAGPSATLESVGAGSTGLVLRLAPPRFLRGTVTAGRERRPVDHFTVTLQGGEEPRGEGEEFEMMRAMGRNRSAYEVRDPDGRFEVPIGDGTWTVTVTAPGHAPAMETGVVVDAGRDPDPLAVRLSAGSVVTGVLRDTEGKPVPGAWIQARVQRLPGEPAGELDAWMRTNDMTDAVGRFHLDGLAPGPWNVQANLGPRGAAEVLLTVQAESTQAVDLQLVPTGTLVATVVDEEGKPVPGAFVALQNEEGGWLGFVGSTDARGVARSAALRAGPARIVVFGRGRRPDPLAVVIRPAETTVVTITLPQSPQPDDAQGR